ncbi:phosphoenolpyruvate carboxylase [Burkholderia sp. Bp9143]|uniref:phosphoenolpyruvate carboxylase n=1 Tax=Burkholderia sp. Bp9143 TaxID=2184574 RepID=UPI000F59565C|nr:phosphoenolpyruvate carboxylase [Burkholderia sp. Bp9143]RQR32749.1 phosphoenolpyruvate carboxylase [Burkholderia sp. Bp9143]
MERRGEDGNGATRTLSEELLSMTDAARARAVGDPFANPVLSLALSMMDAMRDGRIDDETILALVRHLRDQAFSDRAVRIAAYVGGIDSAENERALEAVAERVLSVNGAGDADDWQGFRERAERTRYAAVFTGHPTFALDPDVSRHLAERACGALPRTFESHRPGPVTLDGEFEQSVRAIDHARDALDRFNAALLRVARRVHPDRWLELVPRPLIASTWVGYDTDGRTDIGWWDTLRFRLRMKRLQLARIHRQTSAIASAPAITACVARALEAVDRQIAACPQGPDARQASAFAQVLVGCRDDALVDTGALIGLYRDAIADAPDGDRLALAVSRAGLASHGLALAHTHFRLNAAQLHNAARQRLNIVDSVDAPLHRRAMLAAINAELDKLQPLPVDFGALVREQATAVRTMMTVAQLVKHIDGSTPVRFLIAETESGYTLLVALWLARLFGIDRHVEISPLFETEDALEHGAHVLDEALRSPHYRDYVQSHGRLALQFGYSDSGRYVGQLAASYLIERLRMKIAGVLARHGLQDVEVVLFDTHGESVGRGAHPGSLADRLKYLSPTASRHALNRAALQVREESAFQGGEGYLLFGTPAIALASVARIAEHAFHPAVGPVDDPIYDDPDFAADFFGSIRATMTSLVDDAGYTAMLSTFGPALLDRTGSRPAARQADGVVRTQIRHPSELRAIPNNAILQQLGWCANTVHGLGAAAARQPEGFADMRARSRRFRRALDLADTAFAHSDIDVLRAITSSLDPGTWLDCARQTAEGGGRDAMIAVAGMLERLGTSAATQAMCRRALSDDLALRSVWPNRARMSDREMLLHALRLALIHRVWLKATEIPEFSPRPDVTADDLHRAIIGLDVSSLLPVLARIFPERTDDSTSYEYAEPAAPRTSGSYAREHREIFAPMRRWFESIREISVAITHEVGTFG